MHPEPSSYYHPEQENQHGHNFISQELQDQELAISRTALQVALMEGGRLQKILICLLNKIQILFDFSKDCFYIKLNVVAVCKESLQKIVKRVQKNDITPGSIPHATLKITQTT